MATLVSASGVAETPVGMRDGLACTVAVRRVPDVATVVEHIRAAAQAGAAVAWVRNSVDDAMRPRILAAGGLLPPATPGDAQPPAFLDAEPSGDAGHRG